MSDSDAVSDDFGGFNPTTPVPLPRKVRKSGKGNEAGPSTKPPPSKRKDRKLSPTHDSDVEEIDPDNIERIDEVQEIDRNAQSRGARRGKPLGSRTRGRMENGRAEPVKGKGKARMSVLEKTRDDDEMDVEEDVMVMDDDNEIKAAKELAFAINESVRNRPNRSSMQSSVKEAKLAKELKQERDLNAALRKQLEETLMIRETEPEAVLKREEAQFQKQLQAQETLIQSLKVQLERKDPLLSLAKGSILNLMTREDANEEMRALEADRDKWQAAAKDAEKKLKEKEDEFKELKITETILRQELKGEIERNETLVKNARGPPSTARSGANEPQGSSAAVVRLYEDLTNLLVTNATLQHGQYLNMDEWQFKCMYMYQRQGLPFTLQLRYELDAKSSEPVVSKDQLVMTAHYTPMELDKLSPELLERLDFLSGPFVFQQEQLSLFLRTIYDHVSEGDRNTSDDDP